MYFGDINEKPHTFDLGDEIREEFLKSIPVQELTFEEEQKLEETEQQIYKRWAVGEWLTWAPTQIGIFVLLMLALLLLLP